MPPPKPLPDGRIVEFEGNDGVVVKVNSTVAKESRTLANFISMLDDFDDVNGAIKLPSVDSANLQRVLTWCQYRKKRNAPEFKLETDPYTRQYVGFEWTPEEDGFLKQHRADMWDLLMAASYLDVQSLYYSVCLFLAEQISEKDLVSEVREMFAIDMGEPPETRHSAAKKARLSNGGPPESTEQAYTTRGRRTTQKVELPSRRSERISVQPAKSTTKKAANASQIPMRHFVPDENLYDIFRFLDRECVKSCEYVCERWAQLIRTHKKSLPREAATVSIDEDGIFAKPYEPPQYRLEQQKKKKRSQRKKPKEKVGAKKHDTIESLTKYGIWELGFHFLSSKVGPLMEHYITNVKEPICVRHITMSDVLYDVEEKYLFDQLETIGVIALSQTPIRFKEKPPRKLLIRGNYVDDKVVGELLRSLSTSGAKENQVRLTTALRLTLFTKLMELFASDTDLQSELSVDASLADSDDPELYKVITRFDLRRTVNCSASVNEWELKRDEHVTFRLRISGNGSVTFTLADSRYKKPKKTSWSV